MKLVGRLTVLVLAAVLLAAGIATTVAYTQGYRLYAVKTGSMSPTYPAGTLLLDAPPASAAPAIGTPITFRADGQLVTHRVVDATPAGLKTKGDANAAPDAWTIPYTSVVGRVVAAVPRGGYALVFFKQPTGPAALIGGTLALVLLWGLFFPPEEAPPTNRGASRHLPAVARHRRVAHPVP